MKNPFIMFAVAPAPFVAPTNEVSTNSDVALNALAYHAHAIDAKLGYTDKRVDELKGQVKHLETGFLVIVLMLVVFFLTVCFRGAQKRIVRDVTPETLPDQEQKPTVASPEEKK